MLANYKPYVRPLTEEAIVQYINNRNAFVILARRECVLFKPTHFCFVHEYVDSITMVRHGFKEAMQPFNLEDYSKELQEYYNNKLLEREKQNA